MVKKTVSLRKRKVLKFGIRQFYVDRSDVFWRIGFSGRVRVFWYMRGRVQAGRLCFAIFFVKSHFLYVYLFLEIGLLLRYIMLHRPKAYPPGAIW